jgi:hemoglobin
MSSRESRLCHRIASRALVVALVAPLAACGMHSGEGTQTSAAPSHQAAGQTLYQRLGGKPAITAVVDDFVGNVAADPRINQRFAGADIPRLKRMLVEQICQTSGGPCTYVGRDMRTAHAGMDITDAEFTALVQDLVKSLDKFNVGAPEQKELLTALGGMKGDIVGV